MTKRYLLYETEDADKLNVDEYGVLQPQEHINSSEIVELVDRVTRKNYQLYVSDGKLVMKEV